jgi:peptidase M48, ste24p
MQQQPYQYTKGRIAVERARMTSDNVVLGVIFSIFFLLTFGYFIYSYFDEVVKRLGSVTFLGGAIGFVVAFILGCIFLASSLGAGMFLTRMMRQQMLGNSLEVQYSAYAWLRDWSNEVAADLEMPQVEIFITQNPVINAYAFGFARPYAIVLHSGSIRYLTEDELKVIVVHEMAHIKYKHTDASVYLMPFLIAPIINMAGNWIAGFWCRRTEFTADRLALAYIGDAALVKNALIKVHVGPDVAKDMNDVARQWLQYKAERPMNRFAQTFSDHPYLVRRLSQVDYWDAAFHAAQAQPVQTTSAVPAQSAPDGEATSQSSTVSTQTPKTPVPPRKRNNQQESSKDDDASEA